MANLDLITPLNILILDNDKVNFRSVIAQDKFVVYDKQNLEDYEPKIEEIALIISSQSFEMKSLQAVKILNFFKKGGNIFCPVTQNNLSSVRGICCQSFSDHTKFWLKQSSIWISPKSSNLDVFKSTFPQFCTESNQKNPTKLTHAVLYGNKISDENCVQQSRLKLDFNPNSNDASEDYLPIFKDKSSTFNWEKYSNLLKTKFLGTLLCPAQFML